MAPKELKPLFLNLHNILAECCAILLMLYEWKKDIYMHYAISPAYVVRRYLLIMPLLSLCWKEKAAVWEKTCSQMTLHAYKQTNKQIQYPCDYIFKLWNLSVLGPCFTQKCNSRCLDRWREPKFCSWRILLISFVTRTYESSLLLLSHGGCIYWRYHSDKQVHTDQR